MLSALLPGIRDMRTPLIVGWLWIVVAYFSIADFLPDHNAARGILADAYVLSSAFPIQTSLTVLAVLAYLVGSVAVRESLGSFSGTYEAQRILTGHVSEIARRMGGKEEALTILDTLLPAPEKYFAEQSVPERAAREIMAQRPALEARLLAENRDLFELYDRTRQSAIWRSNLSIPLGLLALVVAWKQYTDSVDLFQLILPTLILIVLCILLYQRGSDQHAEAMTTLATSVSAEVARSPLIEEWRSATRANGSAGSSTGPTF